MSYYASIQGEFRFLNRVDFEKFLNNKELKSWMEDFEIDVNKMEVKINPDSYRNLGYHLNEIAMSGMKGMLVWTSTDGSFEGGTVIDGEEETIDLYEWAEENYETPKPEEDEDNDEEMDEWMTNVIEAFTDSYLNL